MFEGITIFKFYNNYWLKYNQFASVGRMPVATVGKFLVKHWKFVNWGLENINLIILMISITKENTYISRINYTDYVI